MFGVLQQSLHVPFFPVFLLHISPVINSFQFTEFLFRFISTLFYAFLFIYWNSSVFMSLSFLFSIFMSVLYSIQCSSFFCTCLGVLRYSQFVFIYSMFLHPLHFYLFLFVPLHWSSFLFISVHVSILITVFSQKPTRKRQLIKNETADQIPHFLPTTQLLHQQKITLNFQCLRISPFSTSRKSI